MENVQNKINLMKLTQEQIKPVFDIWNSDITSAEDFKTRVEKTCDYLSELDCKDIWNFRFNNSEDLGTLVLKNILQFIYDLKHEDPATQVKDMFKLLEENNIFPVKNLSQEGREYLEVTITLHLLCIAKNIQEYSTDTKREKRLIEFIETVGLFQNLSEKRTLDFAKNVVASNSIHLLKWLFSCGLSPNTMVEQDNDKWPLASFTPTMDMLNVFISHGANLTLTSENGTPFKGLISKRIKQFSSFATVKDYLEILCTVYKTEAATQVNPQEHLWTSIKEAKTSNEVVAAIKCCKDTNDLRDEKGRHIVQFAMIENPYLVNTILSVNEKTFALASTPDKYGRLPSIYWIASGEAQNIKETDKTTVLIPKRIDEETWRQAAELVYELELDLFGICSNKVKRLFEKTTGKKLDEWIEESANENSWFERMVDSVGKKANRIKPSSDIINIWSDTNNNRVVNEAHALFRAHLILEKNYFAYLATNNNDEKQKIRNFLKAHLVGDKFDTLKTKINDGISFMPIETCKKLAESQWWKEICVVMEREKLLKEHAKIIEVATHSKFTSL